MPARRSVIRRLGLGLSLIGAGGTVLLMFGVLLEYGLSFRDLGPGPALDLAIEEMTEHVGLPVLVLVLPLAFASLWVIRRAFAPLGDAAQEIESAQGTERGIRIDTGRFPAEALPFAQAVNRLLGRLDDAAARHEAFAADVAHELRTPLAVLSLELDRIDHPDVPRLKRDLAAMRRLIDQLMLLAQVDSGAVAAQPPRAVILPEIAEEVVALMAAQAIDAGRNIAIETVGVPPVVHGHREAIAAALRNLVENAIRATPEGAAVTVTAGPGATLRVRDEGEGLSPERLAVLVQRHSRADHASRTGAGLGLAIADRIMAAAGGRLSTDQGRRELILDFRPN
ncbi:sensor histidine kinase [Rhizorhabdus phycosphaerae]|uniref:sensor histidine kinase n=1 Tax=Rhizorhabdus phycosphaerae TaxID=2711156 RepID=UPI0013EDD937|nr:HAMP domain-containing sensor histidine kinase [Rhizorhabdus phycosphaerae]